MRDFEIVDFKIEETRNSNRLTYNYRIDLFYQLTYRDIVLKDPKFWLSDLFRNIDPRELLLENLMGLS
jgi:hypothetical protein